MTTADQISALTAWDTPALSNALDALRSRLFAVGYTDGSVHRVTGGGVMAGRVVTARMAARDPGDDGIPVARLHRAVSAVDGPVVMVIEDQDEQPGAGAFLGEVSAPVTVAGLRVAPGDILHGDEHGVLSIPPEALPAILAQAELLRAEEQRVVAWSQSPDFSVPGLLALRRVRH